MLFIILKKLSLEVKINQTSNQNFYFQFNLNWFALFCTHVLGISSYKMF